MYLLDYVPAVLAFVFALLGILTKTTDESRPVRARITFAGWLFLGLSVIPLALGVASVRAAHRVAKERTEVADIARSRLMEGIALLVRPLCGGNVETTDVRRAFATLRSEDNLREVGRRRTVPWRDMGGLQVGGSPLVPSQAFREDYRLYEYYVSSGQRLVMEALDIYGSYLSNEEFITVSTLMSDRFLHGRYRLPSAKFLFEAGRADEQNSLERSAWMTVGLYWFDAVYEGSAKRAGDYKLATDFLTKAEAAAIAVLGASAEAPDIVPC